MGNNDQILLGEALKQKTGTATPTPKELQDAFETFVSEQILKLFSLSSEEIEKGITDGGGDGGIDSVYLFFNNDNIDEDYIVEVGPKGVNIELFVIQSKYQDGFKETPIDKVSIALKDLINLGSTEDLSKVYNEKIINIFSKFREILVKNASKFPRIRINVFYVTKGDTSQLHPNVERKARNLEVELNKMIALDKFNFRFVGARELIEAARQDISRELTLKLKEIPVFMEREAKKSYLGLVGLADFYSFITIDGKLQKSIFETNVRDYQGNVKVNEQILDTLTMPKGEDFWWLNNGITIIAGRAMLNGKILTLEDPQIVNGLQTSNEIYNFFSSIDVAKVNLEDRNILIRILIIDDAASRDRIIRATNSQTAVAPASLVSTDQIHRDIEEYLKAFGYYYDRRKNFYKNQGYPAGKIISIPFLAQCVMSIMLLQPNQARARPSTLLSNEEDYNRIFSKSHPLALYLRCMEIVKLTDSYLKGFYDMTKQDFTNFRFYLPMVVCMISSKSTHPSDSDIIALNAELIAKDLEIAYELTRRCYINLGGTDKIAKGSHLRSALIEEVENLIKSDDKSI